MYFIVSHNGIRWDFVSSGTIWPIVLSGDCSELTYTIRTPIIVHTGYIAVIAWILHVCATPHSVTQFNTHSTSSSYINIRQNTVSRVRTKLFDAQTICYVASVPGHQFFAQPKILHLKRSNRESHRLPVSSDFLLIILLRAPSNIISECFRSACRVLAFSSHLQSMNHGKPMIFTELSFSLTLLQFKPWFFWGAHDVTRNPPGPHQVAIYTLFPCILEPLRPPRM